MTQNAALSLIAGTVIAIGLLVGWCAGALERAPVGTKPMTTIGAGERSPAPDRVSAKEGNAHAIVAQVAARGPR